MGKNKLNPGFEMSIDCYPGARAPPAKCKETDVVIQILKDPTGTSNLLSGIGKVDNRTGVINYDS